MPDKEPTAPAPKDERTAPNDAQNAASRALAQAAEEAAANPLDTTVPGGVYEVNGKLVDAEGKPVKPGKDK